MKRQNGYIGKEDKEMGRPVFCNRCKRGNCGDGEWVKPFLWSHNSFLRKTNENIRKYGKMEKVDMCEKCIKEIKRNGHNVKERKRG